MTTSEKTRILTITSNPLVQDAVDSAFRNDADFELLDPMTVAVGVMQAIENNHPEIILLDFDYKLEETYDLVDKIATRFPGVAVIVILPESKVQFSDRVILSGARAFILYPFTQKSVQLTTRRVLELLTRNYPVTPLPEMRKQMPRPRNTYVVYSPKGRGGGFDRGGEPGDCGEPEDQRKGTAAGRQADVRARGIDAQPAHSEFDH